ncbi:MAG: hypothetical protein KJ634_09770 [Gammaproteobacteria bacterium]|nr:hypothetical protein [Gammaproteobacteria bacterium]MBU1415897.1 hypothetical protein [Gammaproteobacteria bacterium]
MFKALASIICTLGLIALSFPAFTDTGGGEPGHIQVTESSSVNLFEDADNSFGALLDILKRVTGSLLALVVGVMPSLFFYIRSLKFKAPVFIYDGDLLQVRSHPAVRIFFHEDKIENLFRYRVLFFNKGKKEIRKQDIPSAGFPRVVFGDGVRVLSCSVLGKSNDNIGFCVKKNKEDSVELGFEYLNQEDGGVIEVLFERTDRAEAPVQFVAPIIGAKTARSYEYDARQSKEKIRRAWIRWGMHGLIVVSAYYFLVFGPLGAPADSTDWLVLGILHLPVWVLVVDLIKGFSNNIVKPYRKSFPAWAGEYFEV